MLWERWGLTRELRPGDLLFAPANLAPAGWPGPTVLTIHDTIQELRPGDFPWHVRWRFAARYRRSARQADLILVPSSTTADDVERVYGVSRDRIRVIPLSAGPGFEPRMPGSEAVRAARAAIPGLADHPFFLFVGKRSRRRNIHVILDAIPLLFEANPHVRLVFAGPGPPIAADPRVIVAGHVPESVLQGLMSDALALLYPTEYEGFGLPIVEAMASGCPVITLRRGAMLEVGGDAPLYLDRPSIAGLTEAMLGIMQDSTIRRDHITRGLSQSARFRPELFAHAVRSEIQGAIGRMPPKIGGPGSHR